MRPPPDRPEDPGVVLAALMIICVTLGFIVMTTFVVPTGVEMASTPVGAAPASGPR